MVLLDRLNIVDWGLPKILLTDRDPKFLVELWEAIFHGLGVELLHSIAYKKPYADRPLWFITTLIESCGSTSTRQRTGLG